MRNKRNKADTFFLLLALFFGQNMFGQGIVPVQFAPLLLSPSFAGSDTSSRLVLAGQSQGTVTLLDQKGMMVQRYLVKQGENSLNLPSSLANGLYLFKQDFPEGVSVRKLVIE